MSTVAFHRRDTLGVRPRPHASDPRIVLPLFLLPRCPVVMPTSTDAGHRRGTAGARPPKNVSGNGKLPALFLNAEECAQPTPIVPTKVEFGTRECRGADCATTAVAMPATKIARAIPIAAARPIVGLTDSASVNKFLCHQK